MKFFPPALLSLTLLTFAAAAENNTMPLAGVWRFQLDASQAGVGQKWHSQKLTDSIRLPGTTDEARKGVLNDERAIDRLSRV